MLNPSLLGGLLYDGRGHRMTPSHAVKKGMRYRYYVSQPLISKTREAAPEGLRIAAAEIERIVLSGIGELIANSGRLAEALGSYIETAGEQQQILMRAGEVAASWSELPAAQSRPAVAMLARRITVRSDCIDIEISARGLYAFLRGKPAEMEAAAMQDDHPMLLSFPTRLCRIGQGKRIVIDAAVRPGIASRPDPKLIKLLARAHRLEGEAPQQPRSSHRRPCDTGKAEPVLCGAAAALDLSRPRYHPRDPGGPATTRLHRAAARDPSRTAVRLARGPTSRAPHHFWYSTTSLAKRDNAPVSPTAAVRKRSLQRVCRSVSPAKRRTWRGISNPGSLDINSCKIRYLGGGGDGIRTHDTGLTV
jgi:hypothetical protein